MKLITDTYLFGAGRRRWLPVVLLAPGVFFYFFIAIGPSAATSVYSLTDASGIGGAVNWIGLDNYYEFLIQGLSRRDNLAALGRTLTFSFFVTTIQFGLGLLFALVLNQRLPGRTFFRTIFFMPVILGVVVQGLMWKLFLLPGRGPVAQVFELLGFSNTFLGGSDAFIWVITVQIWANVGITMVIFLAGMQTIPADLYEAAAVDGASSRGRFRHVTLPMLSPTLFFAAVVGSIMAFQAFGQIDILTAGGPDNQTNVLVYAIYKDVFRFGNDGVAAVKAIALFVIVLILTIVQLRFAERRVSYAR